MKVAAKHNLTKIPKYLTLTFKSLQAGLLLALHIANDRLLAAMLLTAILGLFLSGLLYGALYMHLLIKNRSIFHDAITDSDPVIASSCRGLVIVMVPAYVVILRLIS